MNFIDSPVYTSEPATDSVLTKRRGDVVTFNVNVNKSTPATVKWFFDAALLHSSPDRRVEINSEENSEEFDVNKVWERDLDASLVINNITCDDAGFYQVEISNPVETFFLTYTLIVEDCKYCYTK